MPTRSKNDAFIKELLARRFPKAWESWLWENMAHYRLLSDAERARLKDDARVLIAQKSWEGCDGLKVTEIMKLTVAAQAALLLLGLEHDHFSDVQSIVLFPTTFEQLPGDHGRVLAGQAVKYGTVFLSWETTLTEARDPHAGHNLVIHEFAHQLDFLDGYTNGAPALRNYEQTQRWKRVMHEAFKRLHHDLQKEETTLLGSYAATNPTEFFSVASERFFCLPAQLRCSSRELFDVLAEYYRVDPIRWFEAEEIGSAELSRMGSINAGDDPSEEIQAPPIHQIIGFDFIDFKCPYCQNPISFPKTDSGSVKQCPNCLESIIVPDQSGATVERLPFPIRTERLLVRRLQSLDSKDVAHIMSKPDTLQYLEAIPLTLEESEAWVAAQNGVQFPRSNGSSFFAVEAVEVARVIGLVVPWLPRNDFDLAQFEIIIAPDWQRKGYGAEAVRALLFYFFSGLRIRRVIAKCDARNVAARRLLVRAGLRQESECIQERLRKGEWVNTAGFAILKTEYEKQSAGSKSGGD